MTLATSASRPRALRSSLEQLEERDTPSTMYALTSNNFLLRFNSASPDVIQKVVHVTGVSLDEQLKEIAFRPSNGLLYGLGIADIGATDRGRLYRINPSTGVAVRMEQVFSTTLAPGAAYGMAFDPATGGVRVVNSAGQNFRLNPTTGGLITQDSNLTFTSGAIGPVLAIAYDRPFDRPAATTLFALDAGADDLDMIGGVYGTPSPNGGVVTSVGPLTDAISSVNPPLDAGFCTQVDFATGNTIAFAAYSVGVSPGVFNSTLLIVDLATGATIDLNTISDGNLPVLGLAAAPSSYIVTGSGTGAAPHVKVFDGATGKVKLSFLAYGPGMTRGVRVAAGDVSGDGVPDIITAAGAGAAPHVKVFDGRSGDLLASFLAFGASFTGGVSVAAGDLNDDGRDDIIVGAGPGAGPHVKVFNGADPSTLLHSFLAYGPGFRGGVTVGAGDLNGDNRDDLIVGAASGSSRVKVFAGPDLPFLVSDFLAFGPTFRGGVSVAAGDVDGDGIADLITGAGPGAGPHVRVFSGVDPGTKLAGFLAYAPGFAGGVRVGAVDRDGDGRAEIITAPGAGAGPLVKLFDGDSLAVLDSFFAYPGFAGGVYVGGS